MPVSGVQTMDARIADSLAQPRFRARLVGAFATMAALLACLGVYGVLAHQIRQRTRELAVRQALGAAQRDLIGHVMRRGMRLVAVGVAIGLVGGLIGARFMQSFLFEVAPTDVVTYAGVTFVILVAGGIACLIPAGLAVRVSPAVALKSE